MLFSCELNPKFCVAKIRGLVNEKSVLMLVDTGSTVSIVNDCFVNRRDVSEVNNVCITSASGDKIEIIGKANVEFKIGNKCNFVYSVYVASNFSYQCIIGLDILCDFSCNVDLGNNCIVFNNEESINFECLEDMQFSERDNLQYDSMNGIDIEESINDNTNTFNIDEGLDNSDQEKLEILLQKVQVYIRIF
ncbi:Hypothetical predicted protein [Mytilus galloprovincialis]|uniref:Peptidase A2 domain-containing protein n=1 Tax=Mytilus galloprovincialis TaxID=29158 RepID=A0A8B6FDV7_MYTGA|nr:Hypothetical predicted protein [Mytilus galloprovincialis]